MGTEWIDFELVGEEMDVARGSREWWREEKQSVEKKEERMYRGGRMREE